MVKHSVKDLRKMLKEHREKECPPLSKMKKGDLEAEAMRKGLIKEEDMAPKKAKKTPKNEVVKFIPAGPKSMEDAYNEDGTPKRKSLGQFLAHAKEAAKENAKMPYREFMAEHRRAGHSMAEVAKMWAAHKAGKKEERRMAASSKRVAREEKKAARLEKKAAKASSMATADQLKAAEEVLGAVPKQRRSKKKD
jgi:hypothetical protein